MIQIKNLQDKALILAAFLAIIIIGILLFKTAAEPSAEKIAAEQNQAQLEKSMFVQYGRAKTTCEALCSKVHDNKTAEEFCAKTQNLSIGQNDLKPLQTRRYLACSDKVPCFLIVQNCSGYTAQTCQELITSNPAFVESYQKLITDISSDNATFSDGCALPRAISTNEGGSVNNWKEDFGYTLNNFPTGT